MGIEPLDYAAILADLEAKRAALEATIASLRSAISLGALGQVGDLAPLGSGQGQGPTLLLGMSGIGVGEVPAGAFHGKSIPEAAKLYLEIVKRKQTSKEIGEALRKGGMESTSKNFQQMVHSVLDRARKANTGIVKLDRSHWGLAGWYPASLRVGAGQEKRARKNKTRRGKGRNKSAETSDSGQPLALKPGKTQDRVLEFLGRTPASEYSAGDIASNLGIGQRGARLMLGRLRKAGKVSMSAPGMYRIGPSPFAASA